MASQEVYNQYPNLSKNQVDMLVALAQREQSNGTRESRKRIKAIKHVIMGAITGGAAGGVAGLARGNDPSFGERMTGALITQKGKRSALTGGLLGALAGGTLGYGLDKLHNAYYESAGFDPTVPGLQVHRA